MKKLLTIFLLMITAQAFAVDITRRVDTYIQVDVLTNTTAAAYENFEVVQLFPNIHKVVIIRPNGRFQTEFCDQINKNANETCDPWNPEAIYADWELAQVAGNITIGTNLTNSERNQYTAYWFYQIYVANDLNGLYNELIADLGLTDAQRRERYFGSCRAYEFDDTSCATLVTVRFDTGRRPRKAEMTLTKVPGRFKKMIDEMRMVVVE